jgi:hypothetical protein
LILFCSFAVRKSSIESLDIADGLCEQAAEVTMSMNRIDISFVVAAVVLLTCSTTGQSSESINTQRLDAVKLRSQPLDRGAETAAGVYVGKDQESAFFITALHPLQKRTGENDPVETVELEFYTAATPVTAKVLDHFDFNLDLAVVYVPLSKLPADITPMVPKDASPELPIHIIGHPPAGDWTSWAGMVQNEIAVGTEGRFFSTSTDTSLTKGFSGGPVFDSHGNFIGMHISSAISFAKNLKSESIFSTLKVWRIPLTNFAGSATRRAPTPLVSGPVFSEVVKYESGGKNPNNVKIGDFNGDGKLDIVAANSDANNVGVLLGNGDGTFRPVHTYGAGDVPYTVLVGDFNLDGKLDLAVANIAYTGTPSVSILLGNGDGTFQPAKNFSAGDQPTELVMGDFNRDGKPDLAVGNRTQNTVSILLGNGDGAFRAPLSYPTGITPYSLATGDFNLDGNLDLAVANSASHNVSVLLGNGDGTFQEARNYLADTGHWGAYSVAVGDFNGDKKPDLAVANFSDNTVGVLLGNGDGTFQSEEVFKTGDWPFDVAVEDFNGDGKLDLVSANNSNTLSLLLGNGDGSFQAVQNYPTGYSPCSVAVGDFNGDGKPDVALADRGDGTISVLLNISNRIATTTTLISSRNPSIYGESVTFTAKVAASAATPEGFVEFKSDENILGTSPLSEGVAGVKTSALSPGSHEISARYIKSSVFIGSSSILTQIVTGDNNK